MSQTSSATDLHLRGTLADLDQVHQALSDLQARHEISETPLTAMRLALDELVTNVIEHGFAQQADANHQNPYLAVRLRYFPDEIEATLEDNGPAFDPAARPPADTNLAVQHREIGGLGLYLVRQSVDSITYERRGDRNCVTIRKQLTRRQAK